MTDRSDTPDTPTARRAFLQNALTAGVTVAGAGLMGACATTNSNLAAQTVRESPKWDMSWQTKLGRYKTVYDAPEPQGGAPMYTVALTIAGYRTALPKSAHEFTPVLVLRHNASFMTVNDAMWKRLKLNERLTPKTTADAFPDHNPFINYVAGAPGNLVSATSSLSALTKDGTIILVCNRALNILSFSLARLDPTAFPTSEAALDEIWKNLIPGAYVMPNGLFAVAAAQDAGCGYVRILTD